MRKSKWKGKGKEEGWKKLGTLLIQIYSEMAQRTSQTGGTKTSGGTVPTAELRDLLMNYNLEYGTDAAIVAIEELSVKREGLAKQVELQAKQISNLKQTNANLAEGNTKTKARLEQLKGECVRAEKQKLELQAKTQTVYDTHFETFLKQREAAMSAIHQKVIFRPSSHSSQLESTPLSRLPSWTNLRPTMRLCP